MLTDITLNQQVAGLFSPDTQAGSAAALGDQLANGWKRYFAWEITFVAVGALLLLGMIAGWRRHRWSGKKTLVTVLGGLLVVEAVKRDHPARRPRPRPACCTTCTLAG